MSRLLDFLPAMLRGSWVTVWLFAATAALSIPLGFLLALARLYGPKPLRWLAKTLILIIRGTPLLLQIIVVFFGLPLVGVTLDRAPSAVIAFVVNYTAYLAEIFRGGISSIPKGQFEAAKVLGLSRKDTFLSVVLPQMMKRALPALGNELMGLVKNTSIVYVLAMDDLMREAKTAVNTMASIEPFFMAGLIYLLLSAAVGWGVKQWEARYGYYRI